jgi:hypothetical protein
MMGSALGGETQTEMAVPLAIALAWDRHDVASGVVEVAALAG